SDLDHCCPDSIMTNINLFHAPPRFPHRRPGLDFRQSADSTDVAAPADWRELLQSAGISTVAGSSSRVTVAAQTRPVIRVDAPLPWLEIIPSTSPNFTSAVNEVVGPDVAGMIASVLPYSVL